MSGNVLGAGEKDDRDKHSPFQSCGGVEWLTSVFHEACLPSCATLRVDGVDPAVCVPPTPTSASFWLGLASGGYQRKMGSGWKVERGHLASLAMAESLWIFLLADALAPGLGSHPTFSVAPPARDWSELPAVTDLRMKSPVPLSSHLVSSPPCILFSLLKEVSVRPRQT